MPICAKGDRVPEPRRHAAIQRGVGYGGAARPRLRGRVPDHPAAFSCTIPSPPQQRTKSRPQWAPFTSRCARANSMAWVESTMKAKPLCASSSRPGLAGAMPSSPLKDRPARLTCPLHCRWPPRAAYSSSHLRYPDCSIADRTDHAAHRLPPGTDAVPPIFDTVAEGPFTRALQPIAAVGGPKAPARLSLRHHPRAA